MTAPAEDPRGGEGHNHVTRDIKPVGECPACDEYWGTDWGNPRPPAGDRAQPTEELR